MNENTRKKRNQHTNLIVKLLANRHKVSIRFVYHAINEERSSKLAIAIKEEYEEMARIFKQKQKEALLIINKK